MKIAERFHNPEDSGSFNMTPIIDIVFLLIIFFLVVCKFIEAENFPVSVPDGCEFAQNHNDQAGIVTVTVMENSNGMVSFAVGSEKISASNYTDVAENLTQLINLNLKNLPSERRIVTLRIDKDIRFGEAQHAITAVAASSATDIQLAAIKNKRTYME